MAPALPDISKSSLVYHNLFTRASDPNNPPLSSLFAVIIDRARAVAQSSSNALARSLSARSAHRSAAAITKLSIVKKREQILVIPTTYANLNAGPSPGAVVGITLGAVFGFLLALAIMIFIFRNVYGETEIVEEELVTRRSRRSHSKSTKKHSPTTSSSSHGPPIPVLDPEPEPAPEEEIIVIESRRSSRAQSRRESRMSRRTSRMSRRSPEEVIVEEELSSVHEAPPPPDEFDEVIVEEEQSEVHTAEPVEVIVEEEEEDIVEVIEEHSPEPPPRRRSSAATRRSGNFRIIDPAEYGGGDAPSRRISRASRRTGGE